MNSIKLIRKNYPLAVITVIYDPSQMDLDEMRIYPHQNNTYKMILVLIDCFSASVWTRPLQTKTSEENTRAISDILTPTRRVPKWNFTTTSFKIS